MSKQLAVFCDFDGTITLNDLGDQLFLRFGQLEPHLSELLAGKLTIAEYWRTLFSTLSDEFSRESAENFALAEQSDYYFPHFVAFCRERNYPLTIVSDGFDVYIKPILEREGVNSLPVFCNEIRENKNGGFIPIFPYSDESCTCFCASCKRNSMLKSADPDAIIVYIGDGFSDRCAAEHADIIFAKGSLAAFCNEKRIPHYPFKTFFDILRILEKITASAIKPRHQAVLKRKETFETE